MEKEKKRKFNREKLLQEIVYKYIKNENSSQTEEFKETIGRKISL